MMRFVTLSLLVVGAFATPLDQQKIRVKTAKHLTEISAEHTPLLHNNQKEQDAATVRTRAHLAKVKAIKAKIVRDAEKKAVKDAEEKVIAEKPVHLAHMPKVEKAEQPKKVMLKKPVAPKKPVLAKAKQPVLAKKPVVAAKKPVAAPKKAAPAPKKDVAPAPKKPVVAAKKPVVAAVKPVVKQNKVHLLHHDTKIHGKTTAPKPVKKAEAPAPKPAKKSKFAEFHNAVLHLHTDLNVPKNVPKNNFKDDEGKPHPPIMRAGKGVAKWQEEALEPGHNADYISNGRPNSAAVMGTAAALFAVLLI